MAQKVVLDDATRLMMLDEMIADFQRQRAEIVKRLPKPQGLDLDDAPSWASFVGRTGKVYLRRGHDERARGATIQRLFVLSSDFGPGDIDWVRGCMRVTDSVVEGEARILLPLLARAVAT